MREDLFHLFLGLAGILFMFLGFPLLGVDFWVALLVEIWGIVLLIISIHFVRRNK